MEFQSRNHAAVLCRKMFDGVDFYRDPVYLSTCVNVYKYVRIILYGSWCLSFTVCKRMLIFLGKSVMRAVRKS